MNNKQQRKYIKNQMADLRHARFTNWGFVVTALIFIIALVGLSFLPYGTFKDTSTDTTFNASFTDMVFGISKIGDSTYIGRPNPIYLIERVVFMFLALVPIFSKKHIRGTLVWLSLLLLILSICMWFNLLEKNIYGFSFDSSTQANASLVYQLENFGAGYYVIPSLPLLLIFANWLTYALSEKKANNQLFVDAKIGKKLLNY